MNKIIVLVIILILPGLVFGQINWAKHVVSNNLDGACSVYAADVNNDSFTDILGAGIYASKMKLWIHSGTIPVTWQEQTVDDLFYGAIYVSAADIDLDGRIDVLGSAWFGNEITWWRNLGGNPIQWTRYSVDASFTSAHEVHAKDIDGDGDIDIYGASAGSNQIAWWENQGSNPIQWTKHNVDNNFGGARSVGAARIDNDSLVDFAGAALTANAIAWWRNNGDSTWTKYVMDNAFTGSHMVCLCDVDYDNDCDIIGAAYNASDIAWWKNNGGTPVQWTKQVINGSFLGALGVYGVDINGDSLIDVIATADVLDDVACWQNSGGTTAQWTQQTINATFDGAWPVHAGDIDGDGDNDVIAAATNSDEVVWFENIPLGIEEYNSIGIRKVNNVPTFIYQNISLSDIGQYQIYDISGKLINASRLKPGVYFLNIDNKITKKLIKIK